MTLGGDNIIACLATVSGGTNYVWKSITSPNTMNSSFTTSLSPYSIAGPAAGRTRPATADHVTINVPNVNGAVLYAHCYSVYLADTHGGGVPIDAGGLSMISVDGNLCSADGSSGTVYYSSFHSTATCIKPLTSGNHTIACNTEAWGDEGYAPELTYRRGVFSYVVHD